MSDFEDKTPETPRRLPRSLDELIPRVIAVETRQEVLRRETKARLDSGAATIAGLKTTDEELAERIESLKEENRVKPWKVVAGSIGVLALFAGAFMAIGEYRANSRHTAEAVRESAQKLDTLEGKVGGLETKQAAMGEQVEGIKRSVDEIKRAVVPSPQTDALGRPRRTR